jgi:hypothetical protein
MFNETCYFFYLKRVYAYPPGSCGLHKQTKSGVYIEAGDRHGLPCPSMYVRVPRVERALYYLFAYFLFFCVPYRSEEVCPQFLCGQVVDTAIYNMITYIHVMYFIGIYDVP